MISVKEIMQKAVSMGACSQSGKATDWKSIVWLFFSPQGREFCRDNNYPSIEMFRSMKEHVRPYGVYVEESVFLRNEDTGLVGDCGRQSELSYSGTEKAYKVILMHGARAVIHVSDYAVVRLENISGSFEIINDGTGEVLV